MCASASGAYGRGAGAAYVTRRRFRTAVPAAFHDPIRSEAPRSQTCGYAQPTAGAARYAPRNRATMSSRRGTFGGEPPVGWEWVGWEWYE
jgi:hypothetical protein